MEEAGSPVVRGWVILEQEAQDLRSGGTMVLILLRREAEAETATIAVAQKMTSLCYTEIAAGMYIG